MVGGPAAGRGEVGMPLVDDQRPGLEVLHLGERLAHGQLPVNHVKPGLHHVTACMTDAVLSSSTKAMMSLKCMNHSSEDTGRVVRRRDRHSASWA